MDTSARTRHSHGKAIQRLLPGARLIDLVNGSSGPNPIIFRSATIGGFLLLMVAVLATTGAVFFPGALLIGIAFHYVMPPRTIAVFDRGVAVAARSGFNGRPASVTSRTDFAHVGPIRTQAGRVQVAVGGELIWLSSKEAERLRSALASAHAPTPPSHVSTVGFAGDPVASRPHAEAPTSSPSAMIAPPPTPYTAR